MKLHPLTALLTCFALSGCAVSPERYYEDPAAIGDTSLCRVFEGDEAQSFKNDVANELIGRGLTAQDCQDKINSENTALLLVAGAATVAVGVVACSNYDCGSGGGGSSYKTDYDCLGGSGNGPYYVQGPIQVSAGDPYDLDRDGDGIGCEAGDIGWGA